MDEDKENADDSRMGTSFSDCTLNSTLSSPHRVENKEANVTENGLLDLSNLLLTNLSKSLHESYKKVRKLDISSNKMTYFHLTDSFKNCEVVNANDNFIRKFTASSRSQMKEIFLSNNQFTCMTEFNKLYSLVKLDLSYNKIKENFCLTLPKLEHLDLRGNDMDCIPDLHDCKRLKYLNLSYNKISSLTSIHKLLPVDSVESFHIASNEINDISEFSCLVQFKLREISIENNPCLKEILEEKKFNYKSYIISCCNDLEIIDDSPIDENVRVEGEWLFLQGNIRKFQSGSHDDVCNYISKCLPIDPELPDTPARKTCRKALEKKRESFIDTTDTERTTDSVYSPFGDWERKVIGTSERTARESRSKTNSKIYNSDDIMPNDKSLVLRSAIRACSPINSRCFESASFNTPTRGYSSSNTQSRKNSTESTSTIIISPRIDGSLDNDNITPIPISEIKCKQAVSGSSREEICTDKRTPSVADITLNDDYTDKNLTERVLFLEKKVSKLTEQHEMLVEHNERLAETNEKYLELIEDSIHKHHKDKKELMDIIKKLIPKPKNLQAHLIKNDQDTCVVKWDINNINGYEIYVDDVNCGKVLAKNGTARITDLDKTKRHTIQIRALIDDEISGELSEKLIIEPSI